MDKLDNFTEIIDKDLRITSESIIDISNLSLYPDDKNTLIAPIESENESFRNYDLNSLFRDPKFQEKRKNFEIELIDLIRYGDTDDLSDSPADLAFDEFYKEYGIAATETLNGLIVKNIHKPTKLVELLKVLSNVSYDRIYSFGQSLLIGIMGLYKTNEYIEITDLVIKCIENWKSTEFIEVLQNIDSKTGFLKVYKKKVLKQLIS